MDLKIKDERIVVEGKEKYISMGNTGGRYKELFLKYYNRWFPSFFENVSIEVVSQDKVSAVIDRQHTIQCHKRNIEVSLWKGKYYHRGIIKGDKL